MREVLDYEAPKEPRLTWNAFKQWYAGAMNVRIVIVTLFVFAVFLRAEHYGERYPERRFLLNVYTLGAMLALAIIAWRGRAGRYRVGPTARAVVFVVTTLVLICIVGIQSCPHATYLRVGPAIFTLSGKRCGNSQPTHSWKTSGLRHILK